MTKEHRRRAAVVTVSDGVAQGVREDASGRAVADLLTASGFQVERREVVPDERETIEAAIRSLAAAAVPLVVTTGGTGFGPRDVTPEATRAVIDREAPGLAEEMRAAGRGATPFAMLSRGIAGSLGSTLIVNLPGSKKGAVESLTAVLPALPHALDLLAGDTVHGPQESAEHAHRVEPGGFVVSIAPPPSVESLLARKVEQEEEVVVGTAVRVEGDPPCRVGQKILLGRSGALAGTLGCAEFDDGAIADAPAVLDARAPTTRTYVHDRGSVEVFLEPHLRRPSLLVVSATPVALHLLQSARGVGFSPKLLEPREDRVTDQHREASSHGVGSDFETVSLDPESAVVFTDHDAPYVVDFVAQALRSDAAYVGVMGSARHVGPHVERLREMGFGDEDLARVRTPVGLDIGARTAEEIALSILAGLVADRYGASGGWLDRR